MLNIFKNDNIWLNVWSGECFGYFFYCYIIIYYNFILFECFFISWEKVMLYMRVIYLN